MKTTDKRKNYAICLTESEEASLSELGKGSRTKGYRELLRLLALGFERKLKKEDVG